MEQFHLILCYFCHSIWVIDVRFFFSNFIVLEFASVNIAES